MGGVERPWARVGDPLPPRALYETLPALGIRLSLRWSDPHFDVVQYYLNKWPICAFILSC